MPYLFVLSDRSVRSAVRRIAAEQMDGALADMRDSTLVEAQMVHTLRKRVKKLRGLLRLVRPVFSGYDTENTALRDAARHIRDLRDAEVMRATFAGLADRIDLPADRREPILTRLDARLDAARGGQDGDSGLAAFREAMLDARDRVGSWKLDAKGFDALRPGLARTWNRARAAMTEARSEFDGNFDALPFHEWRKHLKAHWYHARLLLPIWPEAMSPHVAAADALGELLGDHNDLDVLAAALPELTDAPDEAATLAAAIDTDRRVLARRAIALGRRLLAGSGRDLAERWQVWWEVWRGSD
ncbi:MAG: CHAD domain-containing protein [Gemmobacter sp.]